MANEWLKPRRIRAADVFTIAVPNVNYVSRQQLAQRLLDEAERKDSLICISGPSKSGKSVLIKKTIPNYPVLMGRVSLGAQDVWTHFCKELSLPLTSRHGRSANAKGVFGDGNGLGVEIGGARSAEHDIARDARTAFLDYVRKCGGIIVDDFHYFDAAVQKEILQAFKQLLTERILLVIVVTHYGQDQPALAEPDVTGRAKFIRLPEWTDEELAQILREGFAALDIQATENLIGALVRRSFKSPLIAQELGATVCRTAGVREKADGPVPLPQLNADDLVADAVRNGSIAGDAATFMQLIVGRTPTRERKNYTIHGHDGDVYFLVFKALKADDLSSGVPYDRIVAWLRDEIDGERPQGSQIHSALTGLRKTSLELVDKAQKEGRSREQPVEYVESTRTVYVNDPFLKIFVQYADWEEDYKRRLGR